MTELSHLIYGYCIKMDFFPLRKCNIIMDDRYLLLERIHLIVSYGLPNLLRKSLHFQMLYMIKYV